MQAFEHLNKQFFFSTLLYELKIPVISNKRSFQNFPKRFETKRKCLPVKHDFIAPHFKIMPQNTMF